VRATAILPIKRFGSAKSRLGDSPAADRRPALARAMLADVLAALASSQAIDRVIVVSGEPRARDAAAASGMDWLDDPADAGHSEAAGIGVAAALGAGASCVALLPGDCPLLSPAELDAALGSIVGGTAGVVPDRHGTGTNGLLLAPPDAIGSSFGPGSCQRHLGLARDAGVEGRVIEIPSLALDLDTAEDLRELSSVLAERPELAPATAAALSGIAGVAER
jgi:2-phospho-L-lactate guanylyltransferase